MKEFTKQNNNFTNILTAIDCFSKCAFAVPLKNKTGNELVEALKKIFKNRKCSVLRTDRGTEFFKQKCSKVFKS